MSLEPEASAVVAMVIWTLRVFLPILLFILYYRVSLPSAGRFLWFSGKHRRSREDLLQFRGSSLGEAKPDSLSNLVLVDQKTAPELFVKRARAGPAARNSAEGVEKKTLVAGKAPGAPSAAEAKAKPDTSRDELMDLESLLNYMAFNRKQHRIFHPTEVPPPPSSPHPPMSGAAPTQDFQQKANLDAQMVLQGALHFKKYHVVHDVFESLAGARVQPVQKTFSLMVESMIEAGDLPRASEFLMKMEQGGCSPDAGLLDKVMELYANHKLKTEISEKLSTEVNEQEAEKVGLSADAIEFIPEFTPGGGFEPALGVDADGAAAPWLSAWGEGGDDWVAADPTWSWQGGSGEGTGDTGPLDGDAPWQSDWKEGQWPSWKHGMSENWQSDWGKKDWKKDTKARDNKEGAEGEAPAKTWKEGNKWEGGGWKEWKQPGEGNWSANWKPGKGGWNAGGWNAGGKGGWKGAFENGAKGKGKGKKPPPPPGAPPTDAAKKEWVEKKAE